MNFKNNCINLAISFIITVASLIVALLPETGMYLAYHLVSPVSEVGRICMVGLLAFFGLGLSILFAVLGTMLWVSSMVVLLTTQKRWGSK